ncbi:MAG: PqqD family protein [Bacteroidia bacterium]
MHIKKNLALSDTGFVFNPSTGDSYSVNPIGLEILKMMKDNKPEEEIKSLLLQNYQTDKETIEKDLYDFMKGIEQLNLTETDEQKKA